MKNKKKIIISIVSVCVLIAAYFIYKFISDDDIDKISKKVTIAGYESIFLKTVEKKFNKPFDQFIESDKYEILQKMNTDENPVCRIVSIRYLAKLPDKSKSINILTPMFEDTIPEVVEEAILSLNNYPKELAEKVLRERIKIWANDKSRDLPLNNILRISVIGSSEKEKVEFNLRESQQDNLSLSEAQVYEINLLVPKDCRFFFSFPNFDDNYESFLDSKIMNRFLKTESYEDFKKLDYISAFIKMQRLVEDKAGFLSKYFIIEKLFRDDLKIAIYEPGILIVTFKGKNLEVFSGLVNFFRSSNDSKYTVTEETYNNIKIISIKNRTGSVVVNYADISEYFIAASSIDLIKKSIDCFQTDNSQSITFDPSFRSEYDKLDVSGKKDFMFEYLRTPGFLESKSEYNLFAYYEKLSIKVLKKLFGENYDISWITPEIKSDPTTDDILKLLPSDLIGFYYSKNNSLMNLWNYFINLKPELSQTPDEIEKDFGIEIYDGILKKLSSPFFITFSGIDYYMNNLNTLSTPKLGLVIKISDNKDLFDNIKKLFELTFEQQLKRIPFEGYEIYSAGPENLDPETNRMIENSAAPSFAIIDKYLLAGINPKILMQYINTYKGKNKSARDINIITPQSTNKIYFDIKLFAGDYYKYVAKYSGKSNSYTHSDIENKIKPFFEVLKLLKNFDYSSEGNLYEYSAKAILNLE